jgi:hypothetical protein
MFWTVPQLNASVIAWKQHLYDIPESFLFDQPVPHVYICSTVPRQDSPLVNSCLKLLLLQFYCCNHVKDGIIRSALPQSFLATLLELVIGFIELLWCLTCNYFKQPFTLFLFSCWIPLADNPSFSFFLTIMIYHLIYWNLFHAS